MPTFSVRGSRRRGAGRLLPLLLLSSLAIVTVLGLSLWRLDNQGQSIGPNAENGGSLLVYCAAGIRLPVEQAARRYEKQYGVEIQLQYGGSNTLLNQVEVSRTGDLYLAADNSYLEQARDKGLADEIVSLASMKPVIAVHRDNPKQIGSIDDLLQEGVKVALGNPEAAAVGKKARKLLTKTGQWEALEKQTTTLGVFKPTVNEVANDVKLQSVDAGIVWDATTEQYEELTGIAVPALDAGLASIGITVLRSTTAPTEAIRFARFLGARDEGLKDFAEYGFNVIDGDVWEERPSVTFFAGSVNRQVLEPIVEEFSAREGVEINTVYNGCGILTAQMRTLKRDQESGFPDVYMACDVYYLDTVKDWFQDDVSVSETPIVIVVQKGNPKGIHGLADLAKPGVRLAVGQPEQCTIGVLTRRLLEKSGVYEEIKKNIVTETPTSALLVPNVTTGASDAVLAYATDTMAETERLDVVQIESELARAIQPYSISRSSDFKHLGRRLYERISQAQSSFEDAGFRWRLSKNAPQKTSTAGVASD